MSSMWAPDNAKELQNARQTPRKTPFADQHAKARDQGFFAPDSAGGGSGSNGRRAKSNPGRSRGPGSMDGFPMDRGGGRASGRGRSRAPPFPQRDQGPPPSPMQGSTSRGHRRKSSREREAVYKSIWGDSDDEEKEKDAGKAETTDVKEEKESKPVEKDEKPVEKETQQLTKELEKVKISPPAPPATVVPPPAVITGADWSELTDDEDLAFLEDVPVPVTAPASVHEDDTDDTPGPSNHTGLDVTTANDIDHSVRRGSPRVNVGRQTSDKEGVDVKLAELIPVRPVNPEQAQTTSDIGSEGESTTSVGDAGHAQTANAVNNVNPQAAPLQNSRWASAPRGQGHRGARGGRPPNNFQHGHFQQNNQHNNFQHNNFQPPQRNQPPQNFPRPPQFNRPPPTGPRANHNQGHEQPRPNYNQGQDQQPRGTGSRNAPPMQQRDGRPLASSPPSASESDRSSPLPQSTTSETSVDDASGDTHNRGPRQAAVPRDTVKRLMRGWIGTGPGGMRRGTSNRGRGRAPGGGDGESSVQEAK